MKKRIFGSAIGLAAMAVIAQFFMNCGGDIPSQEKSATNSGSLSPMNVSQSDVKIDSDSALVQIGGSCSAASGNVQVGGEAVGKHSVACSGTFMACTLLPKLGNNHVTLTQIGANGTPAVTDLTINTIRRVFSEIELEIQQVQVTSSTSAHIKIKCKPGSAIQATIYGNPQLGSEGGACSSTGLLEFNIALVAGVANRVVYVQQIQQEGKIDNVSADVDNSVAAHNCSIGSGQSNTDICVAYAGTVNGTCKAGSPVKISVNDEAQHVVECNSSGSFTAPNVVLTKSGMNKINITQKSPFGTTCTTDKNVSAFSQL